ncbi:hypothetical protein [Natronobacterium haloterrestre]|uniref:hypothetical protein n=1 Tax=Natronobacterium haloterrestre TaxID=148448 RepID=UPI0011608E5B|nr:hypothetical protein [Halobiforma haloterrestris]
MEFDGPGPKGVKLFANGELGLADEVHPAETEWTFDPTFEKPGQFTLEIVVEGPAEDEMWKLTSRDGDLMQSIEEVERVNATWDVVVADPDELYQTDAERVKGLITDALALYALGELSFKSVVHLRKVLAENLSDDTKEEVSYEITRLDDFIDTRMEEPGESEGDEEEPWSLLIALPGWGRSIYRRLREWISRGEENT